MTDAAKQCDTLDLEYTECESCAAKPGCPTLCAGCLNNRTVVSMLRAQLASETARCKAAELLTAMWREAKCGVCGQQCDPGRDCGSGWLCDHCGPDTPLDKSQRERDELRTDIRATLAGWRGWLESHGATGLIDTLAMLGQPAALPPAAKDCPVCASIKMPCAKHSEPGGGVTYVGIPPAAKEE